MKKTNLIILIIVATCLGLVSSEISLERKMVVKSANHYLFFTLTDIAVDESGNIYIADEKGKTLLKLDISGKLLHRTVSKKGEGPGDLPGAIRWIRCGDGKVYLGFRRYFAIQVYNDELNFQYKISLNRRVMDLAVRDGMLYIPNLYTNIDFPVRILMDPGEGIAVNSQNQLPSADQIAAHRWGNWLTLTVDREHNIFTARLFTDRIEKWNREGAQLWSTHLFDGHSVRLKNGRPDFPRSFYYTDIARDSRDNIYVLAGSRAQNPRRDIYVLSPKGKHLITLTLPQTSNFIRIDGNNRLYVRGGIGKDVVIKYQIKNLVD
ncbi:MAG: hypothetical protein GF363_18120 [Chitinivibrionales bacterium]|nr:hypothetical protein [Chitinivibrionales bacterium]